MKHYQRPRCLDPVSIGPTFNMVLGEILETCKPYGLKLFAGGNPYCTPLPTLIGANNKQIWLDSSQFESESPLEIIAMAKKPKFFHKVKFDENQFANPEYDLKGIISSFSNVILEYYANWLVQHAASTYYKAALRNNGTQAVIDALKILPNKDSTMNKYIKTLSNINKDIGFKYQVPSPSKSKRCPI